MAFTRERLSAIISLTGSRGESEIFGQALWQSPESPGGHEDEDVARPRVAAQDLRDLLGRGRSEGGLAGFAKAGNQRIPVERRFRGQAPGVEDGSDHQSIRSGE